MEKKVFGWIVAMVIVVAGGYMIFQQTSTSEVVGRVDDETEVTDLEEEEERILPEQIKIGVVLPLTGDAAAYGSPLQQSIDLAIAEVNRGGGIDGSLFEARYQDGKCSGPDATSAIQQLIGVEGVAVIIGEACSGATLAMAPIANANRVVLISPTATSPDLTVQGGPYFFRTAPSDELAGKIASSYAYGSLNARTVAVISESTDYAQGLRRVFSEGFTAAGGTIVADEVFNPGETSFQTFVTKVLAEEPDLIYLVPQAPAAGVNILQQLKNQDSDIQVLTAEVLAGRDVVKDNAELLEGMIAIEGALNMSNAATKNFVDTFTSAHGEPPFPMFQAGAYDTVYLIRDAIDAVGYDGSKLREWIFDAGEREGALGTFGFDASGDLSIASYAILKASAGIYEQLSIQVLR
jgi:branched-chain amino acid transport system substrate-binding protein